MSRKTPADARLALEVANVPTNVDFHRLGSAQVDALITRADAWGYRQPKNANGSRGRYFHAYLVRLASRATV